MAMMSPRSLSRLVETREIKDNTTTSATAVAVTLVVGDVWW